MMENMKKFNLTGTLLKVIIGVVLIAAVTSCTDDDDNDIFNRNDSKFLSLMHAMMDTMEMMTMTGDPDNDFAMMMREHHGGAINMANQELEDGNDSTMIQMARKIITEQSKEKMQLDSFLNAHPPAVMDTTLHHKASEVMDIMIKNADLQELNGDADHDFAILMIQHHQAAMDMADLEIHYGKSAKLKSIAEKTKMDQQKEIMELQDWLLDEKD